jgi:hypothetical protein
LAGARQQAVPSRMPNAGGGGVTRSSTLVCPFYLFADDSHSLLTDGPIRAGFLVVRSWLDHLVTVSSPGHRGWHLCVGIALEGFMRGFSVPTSSKT